MKNEKEKHIEEIMLIVKQAINQNASIDFEEDTVYFDGNALDHIAEEIAEKIVYNYKLKFKRR